MQNWMRDRLRRRKKKAPAGTEANPSKPALEPLQPAYPEAAQAVPEVESTPQPEPPAPEPPAAQAAAPPEARPQTRPRPRRRKRRPVALAAPNAAPPAAEGIEEAPVAPPVVLAGSAGAGLQPEAEQETGAPPEAGAEALESVAAPAVTAAQSSQQRPRRPPRGAVVLAVGLPGSGKSTWFKRHNITPLSSDLLRRLLFDNAQEQRYQDMVFSTLRQLLRARLIAKMPWNYVDATNLSPKERRHWIRMAHEFGYQVHAVYFEVPLEVCQERNRKRQRIVPDEVMQRMAAKLRAPRFEEGFAKITVVRVKGARPPAGG